EGAAPTPSKGRQIMRKSPIRRVVLTLGTALLVVGGAALPPSGPGQPAVAQAQELAQVRGGGGGGGGRSGGGAHSGRSASAANAPSAARSQATHQSAAAPPSSL